MEKFYRLRQEREMETDVLQDVPNRFKITPEELMEIFFSKNRKIKHASWETAVKWFNDNGYSVTPFKGGRTR